MTYRLFMFLDETENSKVRQIDRLYLDGGAVADRALEGFMFRITLADGGRDIDVSFDCPELFPPMMDRDAVLQRARHLALNADILDAENGGEGMIWNDDLAPQDQIMPLPCHPEIKTA